MRIRPFLAGIATAVLTAAAVLVGVVPAHATTITLTSGQSIQAAINGATNGDVIQLGAGTYTGNLTINGKYVTIRGNVGDPGSVSIRPTATTMGNTVLTIQNVPTSGPGRVLIEGVMISGGNAAANEGGGVTVKTDAAPEFNRVVVSGNSSTQTYGGGFVLKENADAYIHDSVIENNSAFRGGAGIFGVDRSDPVIVANVIRNNHPSGWITTAGDGGSSGGAIYLESAPGSPGVRTSPVIRGNVIEDNTASFAGGGVMLRTGVNATIESNTIDGNSATYGGGVHIETTGSTVSLVANTITNNVATRSATFSGSGYGGGVAVYDSAVVALSYNTVSGNTSTDGGGGLAFADASVITLDANTLTGNSAAGALDGLPEGGGVLVANATLTATNNVFDGNSSHTGGGVNVLDGAIATIAFNTFAGNLESLAPGGAVFVGSGAASAKIANNVFADNQNAQIFDLAPKATVLNNLFDAPQDYYGGGSYATAAALNGLGNADGNVDGDPAFINQAGHDFRIGTTSPARGLAASGSGIPTVSQDRNGTPRTASPADAGAYTYPSEAAYFADVSPSHPFFVNIQWMAATGLSTGTPQLSGKPLYKPADPVSRQAMSAFLYRYSGDTFTPPAVTTFADVPTNHPFYTQIEWMAAEGISTGTPQPTGKPLFNPATAVSRQSMALFLARFAEATLPTPTTQSFADVPITASSAPAIEWMKTTGISTGTAQPTGLPLYKPLDPVSRQAMAAFLQRLDDYLT